MTQLEALSNREKEVARLLMQGKSNKQIAQELGIAIRTVEFHTGHIYRKLGVSSRSEALIKLSEGDLRESVDTGVADHLRVSPVDTNDRPSHNLKKPSLIGRVSMKSIFFGFGALLLTLVLAAIFIFSGRQTAADTNQTPFTSQKPTDPASRTQEQEIPTVAITQTVAQSQPTRNPQEISITNQIDSSNVNLSLQWFYIDSDRIRLEFVLSGFPLPQGASPVFLVDQQKIKLYKDGNAIAFSPVGDRIGGSGGEENLLTENQLNQVVMDALLLDPRPAISQGEIYEFDVPVGGEVIDINGKVINLPETNFHFEAKSFYPGLLTFTPDKTANIEDKTVKFKELGINPSSAYVTLCVNDPQGEQWIPTVHLLSKGSLFDIDHGWWLAGENDNPQSELCYHFPFAIEMDLTEDPYQVAVWVEKLTKDRPERLPYDLIAKAQNKLSTQGIEFNYVIINHGADIEITRLPVGLTEIEALELVQKALTEEATASSILVFDLNE